MRHAMIKDAALAPDTVPAMVGSLSERILRRIFGDRYEANRNEDPEMAVAHLIQQRDSLAHALTHWDDAARDAGLTYDAVRDIANDVETGRVSFGRGVELLRSLARVAAEQMAKDANNRAVRIDGPPRDGDTHEAVVGPSKSGD